MRLLHEEPPGLRVEVKPRGAAAGSLKRCRELAPLVLIPLQQVSRGRKCNGSCQEPGYTTYCSRDSGVTNVG